MSLLKKRKRSLNLEKDFLLTQEGFGAIDDSQPHEPRDLASYLDFLDEVWGSERKGTGKRFFSEEFRLYGRKESSRRP